MNTSSNKDRRLLKGVLIGVAGLALLVGGGTFALWSDSDLLPGGDISTGDLSLELVGEPTWTLNGDPVTIGDVLLVPTDELVLTQPMELSAQGTTLQATLTLNMDALDGELADNLTVTPSYDPVPAGMTPDGTIGPGPVDIDEAAMTATVTIGFDAEGQDAQDATVSLSDITFELQQTV
jgi:alternate signal-mediated exported protein